MLVQGPSQTQGSLLPFQAPTPGSISFRKLSRCHPHISTEKAATFNCPELPQPFLGPKSSPMILESNQQRFINGLAPTDTGCTSSSAYFLRSREAAFVTCAFVASSESPRMRYLPTCRHGCQNPQKMAMLMGKSSKNWQCVIVMIDYRTNPQNILFSIAKHGKKMEKDTSR